MIALALINIHALNINCIGLKTDNIIILAREQFCIMLNVIIFKNIIIHITTILNLTIQTYGKNLE